MFVQLVLATLILGSVVAVPPPTAPPKIAPSTENATLQGRESLDSSSLQIVKNPAEGGNERSVTAMTNFRCTLKDYEEQVKTFIYYMNVKEYSLKNATLRGLLEELRTNMASLPKVETRVVTKKYREKCWCDGSMRSPCPEKCMDSCRWTTDSPTFSWKNENDCEGAKSRMTSCYCYEGSSTTCNYGNLSSCYDGVRTEVENMNKTCSHHRIDEKVIEKSIALFFDLFSEPFRMQSRTLAYKLMSFKQSVVATDSLFNFNYSLCCEKRNETPCYPEASNVLNGTLTQLIQLKNNVTMDMIRLREKVDSVSNDLAEQKKKTISQVQAKIEMYECCLKGLDYSDKDKKCEAPASSRSTVPSPPPSPNTS